MENIIVTTVSIIAALALVHGSLLFSEKYYLWFSTNIWRRKGVASHERENEIQDRWWRAAVSLILSAILFWFIYSVT